MESVGFLITDFPAPRSVGNQFLLSISHLTCSSSLYCKPTSQYFSTTIDFWVVSWPCLVQNLTWLSFQHAGTHMKICTHMYIFMHMWTCTLIYNTHWQIKKNVYHMPVSFCGGRWCWIAKGQMLTSTNFPKDFSSAGILVFLLHRRNCSQKVSKVRWDS